MHQTLKSNSRRTWRMKKLAMLVAVLFGTAAASQAGIDIHIGIPLPPLPRVVFGYPAPVVVAPRYCAPPVVVAPPCGPVYGYSYWHHAQRYGYHGNYRDSGYSHGYRSYDRDSSQGGHHGHR